MGASYDMPVKDLNAKAQFNMSWSLYNLTFSGPTKTDTRLPDPMTLRFGKRSTIDESGDLIIHRQSRCERSFAEPAGPLEMVPA